MDRPKTIGPLLPNTRCLHTNRDATTNGVDRNEAASGIGFTARSRVTARSSMIRAWYADLVLPGAPPFKEAENVVAARATASRLAKTDLALFIAGEVGVGRRTLALAVAKLREREDMPVVSIDVVGALPAALRERGSPVIAVVHHVALLDARAQVELATLVRDRRILLVAAGNDARGALASELRALVEATQIVIPPLRERDGDASRWAEYFLAQAAKDFGLAPPELSARARAAISMHAWPGNLAELQSVVCRAVVLTSHGIIEPRDVGLAEEFAVKPLTAAVEDFRAAYVQRALRHFAGNRSQAARALGVDARTIFRYVAKAKDNDKE